MLDEADKLLSEEIQVDIEHLLKFMPNNRQILLYSATFPGSVEAFTKRWYCCPKEGSKTY